MLVCVSNIDTDKIIVHFFYKAVFCSASEPFQINLIECTVISRHSLVSKLPKRLKLVFQLSINLGSNFLFRNLHGTSVLWEDGWSQAGVLLFSCQFLWPKKKKSPLTPEPEANLVGTVYQTWPQAVTYPLMTMPHAPHSTLAASAHKHLLVHQELLYLSSDNVSTLGWRDDSSG